MSSRKVGADLRKFVSNTGQPKVDIYKSNEK